VPSTGRLLSWNASVLTQPPTTTRLAFFLATTRNLAEQQCTRVRRSTSLSAKLCVGMELDMWSKEKWQALFTRHRVIVCTAQILVNLLDKGSEYMTMSRINVLILDECHKAHRNHPYTKVMSHYDRADPASRPRVFGMTVRAVPCRALPLPCLALSACLPACLLCSVIHRPRWMDHRPRTQHNRPRPAATAPPSSGAPRTSAPWTR
jgi:hypothetical protein